MVDVLLTAGGGMVAQATAETPVVEVERLVANPVARRLGRHRAGGVVRRLPLTARATPARVDARLGLPVELVVGEGRRLPAGVAGRVAARGQSAVDALARDVAVRVVFVDGVAAAIPGLSEVERVVDPGLVDSGLALGGVVGEVRR